jgi:hypothetical protein
MNLLDVVFGCSHKHCSFPITVRGKLRRSSEAASITGTYVVCLDCGKEFAYDWNAMKLIRSTPETHASGTPVTILPDHKAA